MKGCYFYACIGVAMIFIGMSIDAKILASTGVIMVTVSMLSMEILEAINKLGESK